MRMCSNTPAKTDRAVSACHNTPLLTCKEIIEAKFPFPPSKIVVPPHLLSAGFLSLTSLQVVFINKPSSNDFSKVFRGDEPATLLISSSMFWFLTATTSSVPLPP